MPPLYFAPMEGATDAVFRRTHRACFGGMDKYFIPFISPTQNKVLTAKELGEILPEHNQGLHAVPQILTKHADHFLWAAGELKAMGYEEANLNLGCPSGTVTGKGKGSGMLRSLENLRVFLDEIYAHAPMKISIKTRIGFLSQDEWPQLLSLLARYPICELIIHPRTRKQFYKGTPFTPAYEPAFDTLAVPVACNGDLFTPQQISAHMQTFPRTSAIMLGRGAIGNPALAQEVRGGEGLTCAALRQFHDQLVEAYLHTGNSVLALVRMRMITYYMASCFENPHKPWKAMRKARTLEEYLAGAKQLFDEHKLLEKPYYHVLDD